MTFSKFLKQLGLESQCKTASELFDELGGSKALNMELRNFMLLYSGKRPPSMQVLTSFFEILPPQKRKTLFISYFGSCLGEDNPHIVEYLSINLNESNARTEKTIWDDAEVLELDRNQLTALAEDPDLLRAHHALMLYENIREDAVKASVRKHLNSLIELGVAKKQGPNYRNANDLFIYPLRKGTAPSKTLRASYELLIQSIRNYVQFEGDENQEIGFTVQLISPENRVAVLNEGKRFKNWIQTLAATPKDKDAVPLLWVSCLRTMTKMEFDL